MATNMKAWDLTHAPRTLYLPSHINVRTKIVTHPRTTNGVRRMPKLGSVGHDTGNPRTTADGEWGWLAGGRQGGSLGGYNAIVDDKGVIYCQYLDWETWHGGRQWWNWWTWGTELAFGGPVVWTTAFETWCAWHGALIEMGDLDPDDAFHFHEEVYGKYCPGQVFNRGLRTVTRTKIVAYFNLARAARNGVTVPEMPQFVKPMMPLVDGEPWEGDVDAIVNGSTYQAQRITAKATGALNTRQWASTQSQFTGPGYQAGDELELLGWVAGELVNGISEWWIDTDGNRLWAGGIDAEPKVDPDWGTTPPETPDGMVPINGRLYYELNDEETGELGRTITIHRSGTLHKWADTTTEVVSSVKEGDERVFRYWTRGEELPLTMPDGSDVTEMIWFAENLHTGARMWSGLSEERPQ